MFGPLVGADAAGALAGAELACAVSVLVGCGEPAAAETCGALVGDEAGSTLSEPPLIALFRCNQAIWSSVSAIVRAA
jgi:hypothetical protein